MNELKPREEQFQKIVQISVVFLRRQPRTFEKT